MKNRMQTAGFALALVLAAGTAWAKLPPPPPPDDAAKAAAEDKKAKAAAAAEKAKADLAAAQDRAVQNYQGNKGGKATQVSAPAKTNDAPKK